MSAPNRMDDIDFNALLPRVAQHVLGKSTRSKGNLLGFGSVAINTTTGKFYDSADQTSGDPFDFIIEYTGCCTFDDVFDWLIGQGFLNDSAPSPVAAQPETAEVVAPESSVALPEPQPEAKEPTAVPSSRKRLRALDRMAIDAVVTDAVFRATYTTWRNLTGGRR